MSNFNWPDVPFSGTEVDAFVVEYKALAEIIYDRWHQEIGNAGNVPKDYVSFETLQMPYQFRENVKTYLENALVYSAFVIKQRAGNSGPGTDFNLGNSPFPRNLPPSKVKRYLEKLGCSFEDAHLCFERGDDPPKFNNVPPDFEGFAGSAGPGSAPPGPGGPPGEDGPGDSGGDPPPNPYPPREPDDDCPGGNTATGGGGSHTVNNGEGHTVQKESWQYVLNVYRAAAYVSGNAGQWFAADMLLHFLGGSGQMYTASGNTFGMRRMKNKLKIQVRKFLDETAPIANPSDFNAHPKFVVNQVTLNSQQLLKTGPIVEYPAAARARLGLTASQKIYRVDFDGSSMNGAFGRALIVSDGTEQLIPHPWTQSTNPVSGEPLVYPVGTDINDIRYAVPIRTDGSGKYGVNKITHILDDYDFEYSWRIVRSEIGTDFAGIETPDNSQIESGHNFCSQNGDGTGGPANRTVCAALTSDGKRGEQYVQRLPVAEAHGDGCKDWDPEEGALRGRPFTVRISF